MEAEEIKYFGRLIILRSVEKSYSDFAVAAAAAAAAAVVVVVVVVVAVVVIVAAAVELAEVYL